ncbi:MAG: class I SAM-dependent methyltransferase, partial [Acetobacteraceae bacterium]
MLAEAGAAQVLGVDISSEAVAVAQERFARPGLEFRTGPAEALGTLVEDIKSFDLIASFETIEHVADPARFLQDLARVLAPGGTILISAPNEGGGDDVSENPFHLRTYSLESFRAETEAVLGPARAFLLGMPVQGFAIADAASGLPVNERHDLAAMLEGDSSGCVRLIPAERHHRVGPERASFFVGVWGTIPSAAITAAPIAHAARVWAYQGLISLRAENARLVRAQADSLL